MYKLLRKIKFLQLLRSLTRRKKRLKGKTFVRIKFPQTNANLLAYTQQICERISLHNFPVPPEMKEHLEQAVFELEAAITARRAGENNIGNARATILLKARERVVSHLRQLSSYFHHTVDESDVLQSAGFRARPVNSKPERATWQRRNRV